MAPPTSPAAPVLASVAASDPHAAAAWPPAPARVFAVGWTLFWLLMGLVAVHEQRQSGRPDWWMGLFWEGTSALVATALAVWLWRELPRLDERLATPRRWFLAVVVRLPLLALGFVAGVYGLRHAVFAVAGRSYHHAPWLDVLRYETTKFALFYLLFAAVLFGMRSHAALAAQQLRTQTALAQAREAQLMRLARQIEPHFLYNTLGMLAELVHTDAVRADRLLGKLADLLRASTDLARTPLVPLHRELELLDAYAALMCARFEGRVHYSLDADPLAAACPVPALCLQPLLENAFVHGVERHSGVTDVRVRVRRESTSVIVQVENEGPIGNAAPPTGPVQPDAAPGVGLANVRERLAALWGPAAHLSLKLSPGGGALVTLEMPCAC